MKVRRLHKVGDPAPVPATVALVDDDPGVREVMRSLLEQDGRITVAFEASTAREAVNGALAHQVGVMILDHALAGTEGGLDAAGELRAAAPDMRIVLCTAHDLADRSDRSPAIDAFVHKHHLDRIVPVVQSLLRLTPEGDRAPRRGR